MTKTDLQNRLNEMLYTPKVIKLQGFGDDDSGYSNISNPIARAALGKAQEQFYMNIDTGSVDTHDGWWYEDEDGVSVNAVDLGEVIEVEWDESEQDWGEAQ